MKPRRYGRTGVKPEREYNSMISSRTQPTHTEKKRKKKESEQTKKTKKKKKKRLWRPQHPRRRFRASSPSSRPTLDLRPQISLLVSYGEPLSALVPSGSSRFLSFPFPSSPIFFRVHSILFLFPSLSHYNIQG